MSKQRETRKDRQRLEKTRRQKNIYEMWEDELYPKVVKWHWMKETRHQRKIIRQKLLYKQILMKANKDFYREMKVEKVIN